MCRIKQFSIKLYFPSVYGLESEQLNNTVQLRILFILRHHQSYQSNAPQRHVICGG